MGPALTLARGALGSLRKRGPYARARLPAERLVADAVRVDPGRLAAYAEVCAFHRTDPLPLSYPHLLGFPLAMRLMARPDFPFPLLGLVHTDIGITRYGPLYAADRPQLRVHAEGLAPHRRGSSFDMVTEARLDGETVWRSRSTYLCRHRAGAEAGAGADSGAGSGAGADSKGTAARSDPEPLPVRTEWTLPAGLGRGYGAVSGDRNPLHLHPLTARPFGFPGAIAHGMWTFARCLAERPVDDEPLTVTAKFRAPVPLPAQVTYGERDGAFEVRGGVGDRARLHLSGRVSSGPRPAGSPARPSRSS
ncbi:hypothetical protein LHJ74_19755 [Streptomyces sp. N2-109]|uniref:MaoC-like domain-containing protein n=1 Tax=Streptomyces gossypii TaxID=2883101 RepID=A0ABT2JWA0_9ACTN|nr:MaoC/PaaZ C-terminal domain-containing protein [Streptomyces gossypii]MCT2592111.1 hypothetical protein [Streptomyces gossypii]